MSTIIKSPHQDIRLPTCGSFEHFLPRDLPHPNVPAFIDSVSGYTLTRQQLRKQALRLGYTLHKNSGSGSSENPGGKNLALIFSPNSVHYPLIFFALQSALIIASLANAGYTPTELAHQLKDGRPSTVFVHPVLLPTLKAALEEVRKVKGHAEWVDKVKIVFAVRDVEVPKELNGKGMSGFDTLFAAEGDLKGWEGEKLGKDGNEEVAALCYSSGTTGLSKGVMTTHQNLTHIASRALPLMIPLEPEKDKIIGVLPFFHIYGMVNVVSYPVLSCIPVVVLPKFDPILFFSTIEKYKITWGYLVPPIVVVMANHPIVAKYDLSSLKGIMCGAAPLGPGLTKKALGRLRAGDQKCKPNPDFIIVQGYGLTETTAPAMAIGHDWADKKYGSAGQLYPGVDARLVDTDGKDVVRPKTGRSKPGELLMRGTTVMKGYWQNERATRETMDGDWFKSGDIAEVDEDGFFYIVDRLKELIKYKGFQVPPAELEALLLVHPKVDDVGVIGIMDKEQATELPRAYVVPVGGLEKWTDKGKQKELEKEIVDWVASRVANHKKLRGGVHFLEAIPKSAAGKILRRELRAKVQADSQNKSGAINSSQQGLAKL